MASVMVIQGRELNPSDIEGICGLLQAHPEWNRTRLSRELCALWDWRNAAGRPKDMAARTLLLKLERVINHVLICFLAYWTSARLARQWRLCGETGEVTRILRQLQTIRLGALHLKDEGLQILQQITKVPAHLGKKRRTNTLVARKKVLRLCLSASPVGKEGSQVNSIRLGIKMSPDRLIVSGI